MCGILGAFGTASASSLSLDIDLLTHRGPDHIDEVQINHVRMGHTRLAIVDVEGGQQPLSSPGGRYWLVSNGEIYNHLALREEFPDYEFQTDSDSEIILALYERYGTDAVHHLDGMFAFVLYDTQRDEIFMARDPLGIKPLYYGWHDNQLIFGSEIKALHHLDNDLQEFPPGHWYCSDGTLTQYYDLEQVARDALEAEPPTLADIRASLERAVEKRLMSDVPLGVYLSGGLDSTIVAALVAQRHPGVHSFAVGVEGSEDLENARRAAHFLGTEHHEYIYTPDEMLAALPEVIYHLESFDPSLVRSAIPNYFLARMTREYVTVVLTGEGADELYAGYHYLKEIEDEKTLSDELVALTGTLYNCNLQRCDRMTMAHSIEARVPFLDEDFVALSLSVPRDFKIDPKTDTEKWALRQAFSDILPDHVAWRKKEQFSKGAGSSHMVEEIAAETYSDAVFAAEAHLIKVQSGVDITSKEMLYYYHIFREHFTSSAANIVKVWRGHDVT